MNSGWTGGQYSVVRFISAVVVAALLVTLAWDESTAVRVVAGVGVVLAAMMAAGWHARVAAAGLMCVWIISGIMMVEVTWIIETAGWWWLVLVALGMHVIVPGRPYGSFDAAGRTDPAGDWRMPRWLPMLAWIVLGMYYLPHAMGMVQSEAWRLGTALRLAEYAWLPEGIARALTWALLAAWLAFVPLAVLATTRPLAWTLALAADVVVLGLAGQPLTLAALLLLHLLAFVPAWLPAKGEQVDWLFYDGHCALCHAAVRFLVAEDRPGRLFVYAPLEGEAFMKRIPAVKRRDLPDSVVLQRADGALLLRSNVVLHLWDRLGGLWRVLAWVSRVVPRWLRDGLYEGVAMVRTRVFGRTAEVCPLMPADLRERCRA